MALHKLLQTREAAAALVELQVVPLAVDDARVKITLRYAAELSLPVINVAESFRRSWHVLRIWGFQAIRTGDQHTRIRRVG